MDDFKEYTTFTVTTKEGQEVEMAVVEEFRFEGKDYVAGALIGEDDTIDADGVYLYRAKVDNDGNLIAEKITNQIQYENVCNAYLALEEEDAVEENTEE